MAALNLSGFDSDEQAAILRLVAEAAKEPVGHFIRSHQLPVPPRSTGEWSYAIGFKSGRIPEMTPPKTREMVRGPLIASGLAQATNPNDAFSFAFTDEAISAYVASTAPSDTDIQRLLGLCLLESLERVGHVMARHQQHDLENLAEQFGVSADRLVRNVKRLEAMGHIEGPGVHDGLIEHGNFGLTSPLGVTWANGGAPPIVQQQRQSISFSFSFQFQFSVSIRELGNAIDALNLDPEVREPIKESVEAFEEDPSPESLRSLIALASDVTTVGTPIFSTVMTWAGHYRDLINYLFQVRPLS